MYLAFTRFFLIIYLHFIFKCYKFVLGCNSVLCLIVYNKALNQCCQANQVLYNNHMN